MSDTKPEATIAIPVDLYNPGQFFACCGLLELAHRLTTSSHRAHGWFEESNESSHNFLISAFDKNGPVTLEKIICLLKQAKITNKNNDSKEGPVFLGSPFNITLDWRSPFPQNGIIKTFAGKQELFKVVQALQRAVQKVHDNEICDCKILKVRELTERRVANFGIEKAENVIDAGFSMDDQKDRLFQYHYVFLEYLALIGAQRFCPYMGQERRSRVYFAWEIPLTVHLAAVAISRPIVSAYQKGFVFQMYNRDPQGRYKGFASARELN